MNTSDNNFNDSMFNFDFMKEDDSNQNRETPREQMVDAGKEAGVVKEFQKLTAILDSSIGNASYAINDLVKFETEMEKSATTYFALSTMQEFNIVPAHFNSHNSTLTVLCNGHPDEELPLRLESLLTYQEPVRIVLQSESLDIITALIERIENHSAEQNNKAIGSVELVNTETFLGEDSDIHFDELNDDYPRFQEPSCDLQEEIALKEEMLPSVSPTTRKVLFVTPEASLSPHLLFAIHAEKISPVIASNCEEALREISKQTISQALIHDSLRSSSRELAHSLQNNSIQSNDSLDNTNSNNTNPIPIRYFNSEAGLLTGDVYDYQTIELFEKNLIFGSYLHGANSPTEDPLKTHSVAVAELCRRFSELYSFSPSLHLALLSAAHWHDFARRDLKSPEDYQHSDIIMLSANRMESLGFPDAVICLLRIMSNPKLAAPEISREVLQAGNVLTVADYYCNKWLTDTPLSNRRLSEIRNDMQSLKSSLSIPEVADRLFDIVQLASDAGRVQTDTFMVHILDMLAEDTTNSNVEIQSALETAGFEFTVSQTASECVSNWSNSKAQALIIMQSGDVQQMTDTLFTLALGGIKFDSLPTIALTEADKLDQAFWSIKHGLEDVFPLSINTDVLIAKITRARKRQLELDAACLSTLQDLGTHGSLADMNLLKVLEASRDSSRPLRLSATAQGRQFVAYVHSNSVIHAICDEYNGIDAIAASIAWTKGIWSIDPIDKYEIPVANLGMTLDSVMLEACLQCDKLSRSSIQKLDN